MSSDSDPLIPWSRATATIDDSPSCSECDAMPMPVDVVISGVPPAS